MANSTSPYVCKGELNMTSDQLAGVGAACAVLLLLMWIAPLRDVWLGAESARALKSTHHIGTSLPFVAGLFQSLLWALYMSQALDRFAVTFGCNVAGIAINAALVVGFVWYATPEKRRCAMWYVLCSTVLLAVACVLWAEVSVEWVAYIAAVVTTLMLVGPAASFGPVIRDRSTDGVLYLPLVLTMLSAVAWCVYGFGSCSIQLVVCNGIGAAVCAVLIVVYHWARIGERRSSKLDRRESSESRKASVPMTASSTWTRASSGFALPTASPDQGDAPVKNDDVVRSVEASTAPPASSPSVSEHWLVEA